MVFEFRTTDQILFGIGAVAEVEKHINTMGKRAFFVIPQKGVDPQPVTTQFTKLGIEWETFTVLGEPTVALITSAAEKARAFKCDFVISLGGGSVLDTGKAVSALLTNPGEVTDYLEVVGKNLPITHRAAPFVAITTTSGTGAEVTRNAVLAVPEKHVKVSMRSPLMLPRIAVVDPALVVSAPPAVTASTGMDALAQVLEPYVSKRANAFTDLLCVDGMKRCANSLRKAYFTGSDIKAREDMAWANLCGGISLANAGLGGVHGFAAPIGGMFNAPHGATCARMLPFVVEMNCRAIKQRMPDSAYLSRYQEVAKILTGIESATIEDLVAWLKDLAADLQIPTLSAYGIKPSDFETLAANAAVASSMKANPIELTRDELLEILEQA